MVLVVYALVLAIFAASVTCRPMNENERYIVMLKDDVTDFDIEMIIQKVEDHAMSSRDELFIYADNYIIPYFHGNFSEATAKMISELDSVLMIEKDQVVTIDDTMEQWDQNVTYGEKVESYCNTVTDRYNLDLLDDPKCTDGTFIPPNYGAGADIYIIDTGINFAHQDFGHCDGSQGSRASKVYDYQGGDGSDCNGHGTHCAGTAAGILSGVAKEANLFSIRVMNCRGSGSYSGIMKGVSAAASNHDIRKTSLDFLASIFSMSIGGGKFAPLNTLINTVITEKGIIVVTAAGNSAVDACGMSPGSAGYNINVGAHGYKSNCDKYMSSYSNYGSCVSTIAAGNSIKSASSKDNAGYTNLSGTSMACPLVAGTVAVLTVQYPDALPDDVKGLIMALGVKDVKSSEYSLDGISRVKRVSIAAIS